MVNEAEADQQTQQWHPHANSTLDVLGPSDPTMLDQDGAESYGSEEYVHQQFQQDRQEGQERLTPSPPSPTQKTQGATH